ncbi:MAG: dockerin type I domain-containing protein [Candidatus Zixiibacteriota bacterium]
MKSLTISVLSLFLFTFAAVFGDDYIVIGWNDLGMHCSNKDFATLVVLPPYNNIEAQVIRVGDATTLPMVVTDALKVTYEIPGNTYSVGKTNFWSYEDQIFGVSLPDNIGLTGSALSGEMVNMGDHFTVTGVPITPYTDADLVNEDPFQLGLLKLYNASDQLLATTQPVVPVSNEINCVSSGCHSSEQQILNEHGEEGANLTPPVLCANCHASNALGMAGNPNLPSLSEAIHKQHGGITNDCYKCHPGPNTQCLRDVMKTQHGFVCQDCHGSVTQVGESISSGREPWFEEPSCGAIECHGSTYAEEPGKLFRESRGHGNLYCSVCHGEPHAIVPSGEARDNVQNIALQGYAGTLNKCEVCHGVVPDGAGPHGITVSACCVVPGDANRNGTVNILDITYMISYLYKGGPEPVCSDEADANNNGTVNILDITFLISYLYKQGPSPTCTF